MPRFSFCSLVASMVLGAIALPLGGQRAAGAATSFLLPDRADSVAAGDLIRNCIRPPAR